MREEIEAAVLFITKLVNKNLSQSCSSASSTHSHSSSSSSSSSSSESPPGFDEQTNGSNVSEPEDKVEQFRQCLTKALFERFHDHWFPEQPTKGQAYRCIRLNEWDRHDITLQKACLQCGIDYKDLQLPVELTLWVDPEEVTCRFGENKGSHCLVAKFKDGELKDNNFNLDEINNIDIEFFRQTTTERMRQLSLQDSPDHTKQHHHHHQQQHNQQNNKLNNSNNNINGSYHFLQHHHQQQQQQNGHHQHHHHHHHQSHNHQQAQPQHPQQQTPPHQQHHHRSNLGKTATLLPSYHHNYPSGCDNNGNPIYYYF